jgi:hypothetical protein
MRREIPHTPCGAKTRTGGECNGSAMSNGKCRMHGGATPTGAAAGSFKHGRNSKYITAIPGRIKNDFIALRKRDDQLRLNDDIALIDARLNDVLLRVDSGEAGALWIDLKKAHQAFKAARASGDVPKMTERLFEMEAAIEKGVTDWQAWGEVKSLIEQRRRLVESERKREIEQQELLTGKEAASLFNALLSIVNENVTDASTKQRIQAAVFDLTSRQRIA